MMMAGLRFCAVDGHCYDNDLSINCQSVLQYEFSLAFDDGEYLHRKGFPPNHRPSLQSCRMELQSQRGQPKAQDVAIYY
jgi:hypothetical protein